MKCPYCDQEMQKGTMLGYRQPVEWHSKEDLHDILWDGWLRKGVRLSETDQHGNTTTEAFHCAACKIVIVPVK